MSRDIILSSVFDLTMLNYRTNFKYYEYHLIWTDPPMNSTELITLAGLCPYVQYLTISVDTTDLDAWNYFSEQCSNLKHLQINSNNLPPSVQLKLISLNPNLEVLQVNQSNPIIHNDRINRPSRRNQIYNWIKQCTCWN